MSVDWPGLLKWSIQNGDAQLLKDPNFQAMDPERREWLEEALKTMSVDQIEVMKSCGEALSVTDDNDEAVSKKLEALETLCDIIEDLDNARDLHLVGAFKPVVGALGSADAAVRAGAANVILTCVQNNEPCKQFAMELNVLEPLVDLLKNDTEVQFKCLGALSALVRDYEPAHTKLVSLAHPTALLAPLLTAPNSTAQCIAKCLFFLTYLFDREHTWMKAADLECDFELAATIGSLIDHEDMTVREMSLRALSALSRDPDTATRGLFPGNLSDKVGSRVKVLQALQGEERECLQDELTLAVGLLVTLKQTQK